MRKSRFLCMILVLLMLLSACGISGEGISDSRSASPTAGYIEKNMTPEMAGASGTLSAYDDGRIIYAAYSAGRIPVAFISDADSISFEEIDNSFVRAFVEQVGEDVDVHFAVSSKGDWWVSTQGQSDLLPALTVISADGEQTEVAMNHSGDTALRYTVRTLAQDGNGIVSLLLTSAEESQNESFLYSFDANSLEPISGIRCPVGTMTALVHGGTAYLLDFNGGLSIFDIASGQKEHNKVLPGELVSDLVKSSYCIDQSGDLCGINGNGIQKIALNGDKVQTVVFDENHAYVGAAFSRSSIISLSENRFLVSFSEMGHGKVFLYEYGEYAEGMQNLHIWALDDEPILREAVMQYRRANPNVSITVEYGRSQNESAQTDEDIIKALNTRLLADECPDVLILDGLPTQGYFASGLLSNLDGLIAENDFYDNVISCYKTETGTFAYPVLFRIPALITTADNEGMAKGIGDLQSLADLCSTPETMYFNNFGEMFSTLYQAYSAKIFPGGASVDELELRAFLEQSNHIAAGLNLSAQATYRYGNNTPPGNTHTVSDQGLVGFRTDQAFGAVLLKDYSDIYLSAHLRGQIICEPLPGSSFVPYVSVSIPTGSASVDAAKEFVRYMLTDSAVQSSVYKSGFSVMEGNDHTDYTYFLEEALADPEYTKPIDDNLRFDLDGLIARLDNMSATSVVLKNKLYEQALCLYQGQTDVDTATTEVMRDVQIYLDEQR